MSASFEPLHFDRLDAEEQLRAGRDLLRRLRTRRSVRQFSSEAVHFELIENAIRAAATAPSGANQQPWRFVVISDASLKREVRQAAEAVEKESYEKRFSRELLEALAPLGTGWRKEFLETAPCVIAVFAVSYEMDGSARRRHYYVQESVGIAVGFLLVALHLSGLATLVYTPSPMEFLNRILERPENERPFALIPVGYPASGAAVPALRKKDLSEILAPR
jgi:nitroreductase